MSGFAWRYAAVAMLVQSIWGLTPSASMIVLRTLPVEGYAAIRYTVAGFLFLCVTLARHRRLATRLKDLPKLALLGVLAYALDSLGTLYGLKVGGVLTFALASSLNAVITALVSLWLLHERASRGFAFAAVLSVAGGLLLGAGKYDVSGLGVAAGGLALIWGAYVLEALGFVYSRRLKDSLPLTEYLAIAQLSAGAFMWLMAAGTGRLPTALPAMPAQGLLALAFVCFVSCGACYFLLYWLLRRVDGHKLAFFDCFHTLAAAALGVALFGEALNAKMALGGALLVAAALLVTLRPSKA